MPNDKFTVPGTVKRPASQPPAISESLSGPPPAESVFDKENGADQDVLKEQDRLNRIGVKSDDLDVARRGVNVVAEGHLGDIDGNVISVPRPDPSTSQFPATYKINNYGDGVPAKSLGGAQASTPVVVPAGPQPAPAAAEIKPDFKAENK
jgi:hypothetical protein